VEEQALFNMRLDNEREGEQVMSVIQARRVRVMLCLCLQAVGKIRNVEAAVALLTLLVLGNSATVHAQTVSFIAPRDFAAGTNPISVAVGDFNGDGVQDLAVANQGTPPLFADGSVSVLLGNGDGTFQAPLSFAVGIRPFSVAVGDFNGDGAPDLAVANIGSHNVSVLLGNGDGTFQAAQNFATRFLPISVAVGDFNGDGAPDLAVANSGSDNVSVLLGNGDGTFQAAQNFATDSGPYSVAVGDFNGDGVADLAVANLNSDNVSVLLGKGDGTFQAAVNFATGGGPVSVAVGDFNGDGRPDLAVANFRSNNVSVLINNTP
jgi:hypothetical protein